MTIQISNIKQKTNLYNKIYILSEKDLTQNLNIFPKMNIYYNKNIFKELLFSQNRDGEDFDFLMELKKQSNKFIITPEVTYNVRH